MITISRVNSSADMSYQSQQKRYKVVEAFAWAALQVQVLFASYMICPRDMRELLLMLNYWTKEGHIDAVTNANFVLIVLNS